MTAGVPLYVKDPAGDNPVGLPAHGMLITPEYLALQKDLHAHGRYGVGTDALECAALVTELAQPTDRILDYGCGQGHLAAMLVPHFEVEEYDPAIEGKDDDPAGCEIVVCADVLEHIEPHLLGNVLLHLRALTLRDIVMVVATNRARKTLADGRNAHLIVEDAEWWRARLSGLFDITSFDERPTRIVVVAKPRQFTVPTLLPITRVRTTMAVEDDVRNENVKRNCSITPHRLKLHIEPHGRTAHVMAYGPSLLRTWPLAALAKARGEDVFTMSGSHAFMIERDVIPYAHLDCDPRPHKLAMMGVPHVDVAYWLASCVAPEYVDKIRPFEHALWHSYNGRASRVAFKIDPLNPVMIVGGGSIGMRALSVLFCRGYRHFEIHGMDCCYEDGEHHAGVHLGKNHEAAPVKCGERWFDANATQIAYARYFFKQVTMMPGATFAFHGDGLLKAMVAEGGKTGDR